MVMGQEVSGEGKLGGEGGAEGMRRFLENIGRGSGRELKVNVRPVSAEGEGSGSDAEVLADLDGKDKEIPLERGAEVLKAFEHLACRALLREPAYNEKTHTEYGGDAAPHF